MMKKDLSGRIMLVTALWLALALLTQLPGVALPLQHKEKNARSHRKAQQQPKQALPMVAYAAVPLYPPRARVANVEGVVRVQVTTDGHRVITTVANPSSHPELAQAAQANVRTWQFTVHEPTTFTVTYRYKFVDDLKPEQNNPRVVLSLPTEVEVDILRWPGTVDMPSKIR